jgi:DNA polymerase III delta subunit
VITELTHSIGLFSAKYIVLLDNIFTGMSDEAVSEAQQKTDFLLELLPTLKSSDHVWIVIEDSHFGLSSGKEIGEKQKKQIEDIYTALKKNSDKTEEHEGGVLKNRNIRTNGKESIHEPVTSFIFTDALLTKQKIKSIAALQKLKAQGVPAEEVHGALWWQTKILVQVMKKQTKGISPYVIKKASGFLNHTTPGEVVRRVGQVVDMYHKAHLGEVDLYTEMERLVFES